MSITTIEIPITESDSSDDADSIQDEALLKSPKLEKKKGLFRGVFSRFKKRKELVVTHTAPTTDEATEGPIELVAAE